MTHTPGAWEGRRRRLVAPVSPAWETARPPARGPAGAFADKSAGRSPDRAWHVAASAVPPHCLVAK